MYSHTSGWFLGFLEFGSSKLLGSRSLPCWEKRKYCYSCNSAGTPHGGAAGLQNEQVGPAPTSRFPFRVWVKASFGGERRNFSSIRAEKKIQSCSLCQISYRATGHKQLNPRVIIQVAFRKSLEAAGSIIRRTLASSLALPLQFTAQSRLVPGLCAPLGLGNKAGVPAPPPLGWQRGDVVSLTSSSTSPGKVLSLLQHSGAVGEFPIARPSLSGSKAPWVSWRCHKHLLLVKERTLRRCWGDGCLP